jgi:shikimate kinase
MRKIFLIGYMGAGKTTVGKHLAQRLNLQFVDLDLFIENRYRKRIGELFTEKGENNFREIERRTLLEVSQFENVIISTGGGTPCFFDSMSVMNKLGETVYLKWSAEDLITRLTVYKHNRPLVEGKNKEEMKRFILENLAKREPFYNRAAIVFDIAEMTATQDVDSIVNELTDKLTNK